ncbi:hypothetical protein N9W84_01300 [bacterium]|nr:hypothetical protein [bacterium]
MDKNHPSYFCGKSHTVMVRDRKTGHVFSYDIPAEFLSSIESDRDLEVRIVETKYSKPYLIGKDGRRKTINYK